MSVNVHVIVTGWLAVYVCVLFALLKNEQKEKEIATSYHMNDSIGFQTHNFVRIQ